MIYGSQVLGVPGSSNPAVSEVIHADSGEVTVATTGNTDSVMLLPALPTGVKWRLAAASFVTGAQGLAANDTNYLTFTITNKSNSNAAMLGTDTTKSTAGQGAVTAYTKRSLTLSSTKANLVCDADDVLLLRAAASGTLGAQMPNSKFLLTFERVVYN